MCTKCGNIKCDECNPSCYNPDSTSALKYDGPPFNCPGLFDIKPGDSLNDALGSLMQAICDANEGGLGGNFYIQLPPLEEGGFVRVQLPADVPVNENLTPVMVDRNLCTEDIIVSWVNLPVEIVQVPLDPTTYPGSSSTLEGDWSRGLAPVITVPVGISAGVYTDSLLRLTSATCGTIDLPVQIQVT